MEYLRHVSIYVKNEGLCLLMHLEHVQVAGFQFCEVPVANLFEYLNVRHRVGKIFLKNDIEVL